MLGIEISIIPETSDNAKRDFFIITAFDKNPINKQYYSFSHIPSMNLHYDKNNSLKA